ncbi:MAG: sodium-translocating pyrophosphatase [Candidatus Bathyarchaeota archaeon]|nr:sodium-translocating pyrophosphatase [Candidatus Bathyarchaeota archaeon]MDH5746506.1 sodium-translocating pyrophosphatase [Candidatus Bathyarchaeota archaeon]
MEEWLIAPISALISILVAIYLYYYVKRQKAGTKRMREISGAIQEGANAFLKREYKTLATFVVVVVVLLLIFVPAPIWITETRIKNISLALAYMFGSFSSALAGYFGMDVALKANVRTANAARNGLNKAFPVSFRGGAVMGLSVVGLALLGVSIVYGLTGDPEIVLGFSIGASTLTLFAKAGGGIYTKTADVSADLVGKVELSIPEDDPRNPAVIADNVGDNVGDVAGMGADLFDSYVACVMAAMLLAVGLLPGVSPVENPYVNLALIFAGLGIIASILGVAVVRVGRRGDPGKALNLGTYITCFLFGVLTLVTTFYLQVDYKIWGATVVGLIAGVIIGITSDYYTSINRPPARITAESSKTGPAITILTGFSYGLVSVFPPLLGIAIASASAYFLCESISSGFGVYGIGMSALGMLSIVGTIVAGDAYGPIGDNAKGIAEQSGLGEEVIKITDKLDAAGNTTKAISKGFAIGAAGLTALALLATYRQIVKDLVGELIVFDLMDPLVMLGVFIGITVPCLFSALCMLAVSKNSSVMIEEIRRQFREIPGLREGKEGVKPDYASCVDIATKAALKALLPLIVMSIMITLAVGFICGIKALAGYLAGSIFSGFMLAILMANSGGMWDNAKKYIEDGQFGGKGSDAHKAAVIGDTVGDPFKDTAGPSLNTLVTVISQIASLFAPLIIAYALVPL